MPTTQSHRRHPSPNRLSDTYGRAGPTGARAFPEAADLAATSGKDLRKLGYSTRKGDVLVALARQIDRGALDFDDLAEEDDDTLVSRLCELDGVGRWSAEYIMLRGLGRVNIFPGDDVGARNKLRRWLSIGQPLDYPAVGSVVGRWQPYVGLVYFICSLKASPTQDGSPRPRHRRSPDWMLLTMASPVPDRQRPKSNARTGSDNAPVGASW